MRTMRRIAAMAVMLLPTGAAATQTVEEYLATPEAQDAFLTEYNRMVETANLRRVVLEKLVACENTDAARARLASFEPMEEIERYADIPDRYKSFEGVRKMRAEKAALLREGTDIQISVRRCVDAQETNEER